jgi:flagellar biosynthesis protein
MRFKTKKAVALEYGQQESPTLIAKGDDELALEIIAEAKKYGIFIAEDPQLVAALSQVGLSEEIPEELYQAVAVILAWAYWLKGLSLCLTISGWMVSRLHGNQWSCVGGKLLSLE